MTSRRTVGSDETSYDQKRRAEFQRHINAANVQFGEWVEATLTADPMACLAEGSKDYVRIVEHLNDRYLRQHGEVFTFGSGECGQAGHGVEEERDLIVKKPRIVHSLRDKQIRSLAAGGLHTVAVGADGRVWTWGCNDDGALGRVTTSAANPDAPDENMPMTIGGALEGKIVVMAACGDAQSFALTLDGQVYGWGCYKDKEGKKWFDANGAGKIKRQQDEPMKINSLGTPRVAEIVCCASSNAALLEDGTVRTWGIGEAGELARPVGTMKPSPNAEYDHPLILREHLTPQPPVLHGSGAAAPLVKGMGAGSYHLMLIAAEGEQSVFSSGLNNYGQLGVGSEQDSKALVPVPALDGRGIQMVNGGTHHSIALADTGEVYAWGRADYGQLGMGEEGTSAGAFENEPLVVPLPKGVVGKHLTCGENHNLLLTTDNRVYSWGFGQLGQLGHSTEDDELSPREINMAKAKLQNLEIMQIEGGGQHSVLLGSGTSTK